MQAKRFVELGIGLWLLFWMWGRWQWYGGLPPRAAARWCGNCMMAAIGVPTEAGLVGATLVLRAAIPPRRRRGWAANLVYAVTMFTGMVLTPMLLGIPIFAWVWGRWTVRSYFGKP